MNLDVITLWKDRTAKAGAVLCILAILFAIDGAIAHIREPFNSFRLLRGESVKLTGPMAPAVFSLDQMTYESDSHDVVLSFDNVISGFWMGGKMWRGLVSISPDIEPGQFELSIFGKVDQKKIGQNTFKLFVYKDRAAYLADSNSFILRYLGVSPWVMASSFFGLLLLVCGCLYLISGRREELMAANGEAEVFHIVKDEEGFSVYFGLGERDGIEKGTRVVLMNDKREPIEELVVESVSKKDGVAKVGLLCTVRPGYLVKKV
jgi:hypothetical protein